MKTLLILSCFSLSSLYAMDNAENIAPTFFFQGLLKTHNLSTEEIRHFSNDKCEWYTIQSQKLLATYTHFTQEADKGKTCLFLQDLGINGTEDILPSTLQDFNYLKQEYKKHEAKKSIVLKANKEN